MEHQPNLLDAFEPVATETWYRAIERFLKGQPLEALEWEAEPHLTISPLRRRHNSPQQHLGLVGDRPNNRWALSECWSLTTPEQLPETNAAILLALEKGVNAILLEWAWIPSTPELEAVLRRVELGYVQVHLSFLGKDLETALSNLAGLPNATQFQGSLAFAQVPSPQTIADRWETIHNDFRQLRCLTLRLEASTTTAMAEGLYQASQYADVLLDAGYSMKEIVQQLRFELPLNVHYFTAIAHLRAFRRLWLGVLEAYQAPEASFPWIHTFTVNDEDSEQYRNLLVGTTQALSAVVGGVDSLWVTPANSQAKANEFTRRMARNVQHLLQAESYLDRVVDPAAGAYYIEHLTERLAERAWQQFCTM